MLLHWPLLPEHSMTFPSRPLGLPRRPLPCLRSGCLCFYLVPCLCPFHRRTPLHIGHHSRSQHKLECLLKPPGTFSLSFALSFAFEGLAEELPDFSRRLVPMLSVSSLVVTDFTKECLADLVVSVARGDPFIDGFATIGFGLGIGTA